MMDEEGSVCAVKWCSYRGAQENFFWLLKMSKFFPRSGNAAWEKLTQHRRKFLQCFCLKVICSRGKRTCESCRFRRTQNSVQLLNVLQVWINLNWVTKTVLCIFWGKKLSWSVSAGRRRDKQTSAEWLSTILMEFCEWKVANDEMWRSGNLICV